MLCPAFLVQSCVCSLLFTAADTTPHSAYSRSRLYSSLLDFPGAPEFLVLVLSEPDGEQHSHYCNNQNRFVRYLTTTFCSSMTKFY